MHPAHMSASRIKGSPDQGFAFIAPALHHFQGHAPEAQGIRELTRFLTKR
jgi:hypothetical protein